MKKQKLALNKETVRHLQPHELQQAAGGSASFNICVIRSGTCGIFSIAVGGCKQPISPSIYIDPVP